MMSVEAQNTENMMIIGVKKEKNEKRQINSKKLKIISGTEDKVNIYIYILYT